MNRSIAKTRNQLQRITLKINQLKTKYTGDVYLHSNPTIETSSISSSHTQTQFRQIQKEYERSRQTRDPIVSGFPNKQSQSISKNLNHNNSQVYCQPQCHSQSQPSMGNEQLYQKQFKIFRNEIYNYIDRCIGGGKQRQEEIIQRAMEKYAQKQKTIAHQNNKSRGSMQERIKKIQQQTTNCLTNIQDLLVQVKKNQKYTNEKIVAQDTKFKKQTQELSMLIKKISGCDSDRIPITLQQLHIKLMGVDKFQKQFRQQAMKQNKKLNSIDDAIQQINLKIENMQDRVNTKITQSINSQEQVLLHKHQSLSQQINKYHQFNVMLEKEILELKARVQQNQLEALQNQVDESHIINKLKLQLSHQFQQKIAILEENIHKNLTDLASLAQTFLSLESRLSQTSSFLTNSQQLMKACNQKIEQVSIEIEKNRKLSEQTLKQKIISNFEGLSEKMRIEVSGQVEEKLKKVQSSLKCKINDQIFKKQKMDKENIQSSLFDKLSLLINQHEEEIMKKIIESEERIIKVQQIQLMFNDLKNKLCEQIEAEISQTLAMHQENLIEKIKSQQIVSNIVSGTPTSEIDQIEVSIQNRVTSQIEIRLKNLRTEIQAKIQEKYKEIKRDKLNNIQCHHDDWSEQMSNEIQNKVKKFIFEDENSITVQMNKMEQKVQQICNNFQLSQRLLISNLKQNKIEDNSTQIRRNDTLQSSQIGSQGQKNSPKLEEAEQKKIIQLVEQKLTQFENDINETIKLLYQDIENKVNEMIHQSGIIEFRNNFQIFKSEISSLSTLVNSLILMNQTKTQQPMTKNLNNELLNIQNQMSKSRSQIYSQMSIQIEKISAIVERACEEVQLKVQKLDQNFTYMYERLSNIEYDNANFKDKLSYFLAAKESTPKIETRLIIDPKSQKCDNILDVLGKFSTGKKDFFQH